MVEFQLSPPAIKSLDEPLGSNAQYSQMPKIPRPDNLNWRLVNASQLLALMKVFTNVEFNLIRQSLRRLVKKYLTNPNHQNPKQNPEEWGMLLAETLKENDKLTVFLPDLWPIEVWVCKYLHSQWKRSKSAMVLRATKSRSQPPFSQGSTKSSSQTRVPSVDSSPRSSSRSQRSLACHRFIGDPQYIRSRASAAPVQLDEGPGSSVVSDRATRMMTPRLLPAPPLTPKTPSWIATPPGACYSCGAIPTRGMVSLDAQLAQAGFGDIVPYLSALEAVGVRHAGHVRLMAKWGEADRAAVCASIPANLITPLRRILLGELLTAMGRAKVVEDTDGARRTKPTGCQIHPLPSMMGVSASLRGFMASRGIEELVPTFVFAGIKTDDEFKAFSALAEQDKIRVFLDACSPKLNPLQTMMVRVAFKGTEYQYL